MRPFAAALALSLGLGGLAAASPPHLAAQDAYRLAQVGTYHMPSDGAHLACPSGSYIVGLEVEAATYVHGFALKCARPSSRVTLGRPFDGPSARGLNAADIMLPGLSTRQKLVFCGDDQVLAGLSARGGDWVDRINSMRCVRYRASTTADRDVSMGGRGGTTTRAYCRGSDRVTTIRVNTGSWMNYFELHCGGW